MILPVENKKYAMRKVWAVNSALLLFMFFFIPNSYSLYTIVICLIILASSSVISYFYIKKHNIKKLEFINNSFVVDYNSRILRIPLNQINNISSALNSYIQLNGRISKMYFIQLKDEHEFGERILLKYEVKDKLQDDPKFIIDLKKTVVNSAL